jgi:plastocyanin
LQIAARIVRTMGIAALASIALSACSPRSTSRPAPEKQTSKPVLIETFSFKPEAISVKTGTKVTWSQKDDTVHRVISGNAGPIDPATSRAEQTRPDGMFDSGDLAQGETFSFTFNEPDSYQYFCLIHPEGMRGVINVAD